MFGPRAMMVTVAVIATLAGGGSAAANWGSEPGVADVRSGIAAETTVMPLVELPSGCIEDSSSEGSID